MCGLETVLVLPRRESRKSMLLELRHPRGELHVRVGGALEQNKETQCIFLRFWPAFLKGKKRKNNTFLS